MRRQSIPPAPLAEARIRELVEHGHDARLRIRQETLLGSPGVHIHVVVDGWHTVHHIPVYSLALMYAETFDCIALDLIEVAVRRRTVGGALTCRCCG